MGRGSGSILATRDSVAQPDRIKAKAIKIVMYFVIVVIRSFIRYNAPVRRIITLIQDQPLLRKGWSGRAESNRHVKLGKLSFYH